LLQQKCWSFFMHYLYIIYSKKIDQFYIGESEDPETRLVKHNNKLHKHAFTSRADDWELKVSIAFPNIIQAKKAEVFVKKMKSRRFNEALIKENRWLVEKFSE